MATYKTPGVYIEEISIFPPSVAQVETAIPAFLGYTEKAKDHKETDLTNTAVRIKSMVDYESLYGGPAKELPTFVIDADGNITGDIPIEPVYKMYYSLQLYFANGGGPCYIISVGGYTTPAAAANISSATLKTGLPTLKKEDEPTIILFPDAINIADDTDFHSLYVDAMQQCADLGDRVTICDVKEVDHATDPVGQSALAFRNAIGTSNLMYGAAYYPFLKSSLSHAYPDHLVDVTNNGTAVKLKRTEDEITANATLIATSLFHMNNGASKGAYYEIKKRINDAKLIMPPSAAIAGVYAKVDSTRGVWKAPANVSLNYVSKPNLYMENADQDGLNVSDTGKSINAVRFFTGKGTLVWGARTLDGNSLEWKYISTRRFFNMVEESIKKATEPFVFEPNDANTWVRIKAMIENFLTIQWRDGALMGSKENQAFFVNVGLGETMTELDVLEGRLIVEIGMAAVRPAEFIILKFSHKMIEA